MVEGVVKDGIASFKGIPSAAPPVAAAGEAVEGHAAYPGLCSRVVLQFDGQSQEWPPIANEAQPMSAPGGTLRGLEVQ